MKVWSWLKSAAIVGLSYILVPESKRADRFFHAVKYVQPFLWTFCAISNFLGGNYFAGTLNCFLFAFTTRELFKYIKKRKEDIVREVMES